MEPTLLLGKSKRHYPADVVYLEKLIVLGEEEKGTVSLTPLDNYPPPPLVNATNFPCILFTPRE